mgnify:CR=1 FL=1
MTIYKRSYNISEQIDLSPEATLNYENILVEYDNGVGQITLNRPNVLNALSSALMRELDEVISKMENEIEVKAIIITGSGRAFSAGADIKEMTQLSKDGRSLPWDESREGYLWHLATCKKPIIGAINGLAFGGGAMLASALDLRVGSTLCSFKYLGVTYGRLNSTWSVPILVPMPIAKDLLLTGREVKSDEAFRIGLLNRLVEPENLIQEAKNIGEMIANNNPRMVEGIKRLLNQNIGTTWQEMIEMESKAKASDLKDEPVENSFKGFLERKKTHGDNQS